MKFKKLIVFIGLIGLIAGLAGPFLIRTYNPWWSSGAKQFKNLTGYYEQKINWRSCFSEFRCANLSVPVNYQEPRKSAIQIAIIKLPASNKKLGSLVVNPGGPGASGVDYAYGKSDVIGKEVLANFDLVGFDPRGVARSEPIKCLTNKETDDYYATSPVIDSSAKLAKVTKLAQTFANKCLKKNKYLEFMTTENAARDMDILRSALGEKKLNFLGNSYGTYLGTLYLNLFPGKSGKFILDGAIDPTLNSETQLIDQANGFDKSVKEFENSCIDCKKPLTQYFKSFKPLKDKSGRVLTEPLAIYAIAAAMYDPKKGFPKLAEALKDYEKGSATKFLELSDLYTGRLKNGDYYSNEAEALDVITCLDWPNTGEAINSGSGFFAKYLASSNLICKFLPKAKEVKLNLQSSQTLVITTTSDPATPYKWAVGLSRLIPGSKLITLNGSGHTGHNRGSKCVDQAVNNFLINGQIPQENLVCAR